MTIKEFFTKTPKYKECFADNFPLFFQILFIGIAVVFFITPAIMTLIK